jgi:hypothetical protein
MRRVAVLFCMGALMNTGIPPVSASDVDLAKAPYRRDDAWPGKPVSEVLAPDAIDRIVLLKAITSAPPDIDFHSIREMLRTGERFQKCPEVRLHGPLNSNLGSIWEAVVVTRDGAFFRFIADGEWVSLVGAEGAGCYPQSQP